MTTTMQDGYPDDEFSSGYWNGRNPNPELELTEEEAASILATMGINAEHTVHDYHARQPHAPVRQHWWDWFRS
jgi:hypothetical protein